MHVFANSLAGYLCLYYLSHIIPARNFIASLVLCNSFCDTTMYQRQNGNGGFCMSLLKHAPGFVLRKYVLDSLPDNTAYPEAVDFMIEQLDEMPREVLASRLILNILKSRGVAQPDLWKNKDGTPFSQQNVTIMDVSARGDENASPMGLAAVCCASPILRCSRVFMCPRPLTRASCQRRFATVCMISFRMRAMRC